MATKSVLLIPYDPVHDIGLKMIKRALDQNNHQTMLLPPDLPVEEIIHTLKNGNFQVVLVSRTLGYGVAELLARFIDMTDAAGLRDNVRIAVGGMSIRPELAQELGFDAGFGAGASVEDVVAFVEERIPESGTAQTTKTKADITTQYSYHIHDPGLAKLLNEIAGQYVQEVGPVTSPGVERAKLRADAWNYEIDNHDFIKSYLPWCDEIVRAAYIDKKIHPKTRRITDEELSGIKLYVERTNARLRPTRLQHTVSRPLVFIQYGTGCPLMDIAHIKVAEAWGADGVVHFDPSWGARTEGFMPEYLSHQEDGTVITPENLHLIHRSLNPGTLWQVRAHRGLNTPETVVLAAKMGADLTKINIAYGCLGGGTDPERLAVDAYHCMKYASQYKMPFDIVTNEELSGVPAYKAFAGMLITAAIAIKLQARPILQPLFCYSPEMMITGNMADNYIDFNFAKVNALKAIIDAPIWPGAPIGFLTQTEDRVQSSLATSLHAGLALACGVDAISIASSDEAYSGGPIVAASRVDTLCGVKETFRFWGKAGIAPTPQAAIFTDELQCNIRNVLRKVLPAGGFIKALYAGVLGSPEDGAYPGRAGRDTVKHLQK